MSLIVEIQTPASEGYRDLLRYYSAGDYNAQYLRGFEFLISPLIRNGFLANDEDYCLVTGTKPLPSEKNPNQYITRSHFELYLRMYERIMRKNHIVGGFDAQEDSVQMEDVAVDPFEEYRR